MVLPEVKAFEAIPGHGIRGTVDGRAVLLGNRRLFAREGIDTKPAEETMMRLEQEGKTAMLIGADGALAGVIAVADTSSRKPRRRLRRCKMRASRS